ncbi:MAG: tRNA (pseudouridine(54)-N(1))-methyltransferase TrmY [Candidatus Nanoarchaeia archaeon]
MKKTFILYSYGTTNPNFNLNKLYEAGRLDLVCRCVIAALWLSKTVRKDTQFYVVLNSGPRPPVAIKFDGAKLIGIEPSERAIGTVIKKALKIVRDKNWIFVQEGVFVSKKSFQEIIKETKNIFVLDATGTHISKIEFDSDVTFVLGDHVGLPKKEMQFALRKGTKVSLGNKIYLASAVINIVNWVLDG